MSDMDFVAHQHFRQVLLHYRLYMGEWHIPSILVTHSKQHKSLITISLLWCPSSLVWALYYFHRFHWKSRWGSILYPIWILKVVFLNWTLKSFIRSIVFSDVFPWFPYMFLLTGYLRGIFLLSLLVKMALDFPFLFVINFDEVQVPLSWFPIFFWLMFTCCQYVVHWIDTLFEER